MSGLEGKLRSEWKELIGCMSNRNFRLFKEGTWSSRLKKKEETRINSSYFAFSSGGVDGFLLKKSNIFKKNRTPTSSKCKPGLYQDQWPPFQL